MLGVDVDETASQVTQLVQGDGRVIYERTALARCQQLAAHDGVIGIKIQVIIPEELLQAVTAYAETALYGAFISSLAQGLGISTSTQQKVQGAQNDGLTGTCLTGHD